MSQSAKLLEKALELELEDFAEIQLPDELIGLFGAEFCKKHQLIPLRWDDENKTLSVAFAQNEIEPGLSALKNSFHWKHLSVYRMSAETFKAISANVFLDHLPDQKSIAIIEKDDLKREALSIVFEREGYDVLGFSSETKFLKELDRIASKFQPGNEDLIIIGDEEPAIPFQMILAKKSSLDHQEDFANRVWSKLNSVQVSLLDEDWIHSLFSGGILQSSLEKDELTFHIRHENFYLAAIECLKKNLSLQAVEFLEKVKDDDPYFLKAKVLLGKTFIQKKNFKKASEHLQKAYDFWCEDPESIISESVIKLLYYLGYSFEKLNRLDDALKLYERVALENPKFQEVADRISKINSKRKKAAQSREKKLGLPAFSASQKPESRYEKIEEIGKGGMGLVYLAKDKVLGRDVALKILNSHFKHDEKIVETFLREAKSLAVLNHLNIVTIFDAGIEDGNYYISMEYIDGKTVRDILKKKNFIRLSTSLAIARQVLKALAYAHSKHVIHRDITTNNLMLTETKIVKLMDFGLARVVNQLHSEQSIIGGTPYFMSPEQVEGAPIDHRTDIYSFGVCLFEMLTGQVPFPMENPGYHHLHSTPPNPKTLKSDLPNDICEIILKCLKKKPKDRFQSADEILDEIRRFSND